MAISFSEFRVINKQYGIDSRTSHAIGKLNCRYLIDSQNLIKKNKEIDLRFEKSKRKHLICQRSANY